jgi:hypothetical protein
VAMAPGCADKVSPTAREPMVMIILFMLYVLIVN